MKTATLLLAFLTLSTLYMGCGATMLASCYETTINFGNEGQLGSAHEEWDRTRYANALLGAIEVSDPIPLSELCPEGVSYIEQSQRPLDSALQHLTVGMYVSTSVSVYCNDQFGMEVDLNEEGQVVAIRPLR